MEDEKTRNRPNILMVICHDLGQHLGCYGAPVETPHIDCLAGEGLRMENHFCTAPQCSPSRGSIMTGKYPHRNGLIGLAHLGWELNTGEKTLPMFMNEAGYETFLFGNQHESLNPETLGYSNVFSERMTPGAFNRLDRLLFSRYSGGRGQKPFYASLGIVEPHRLKGTFANELYKAEEPSAKHTLPYLPDRPGIRTDIAGLNAMVRTVDEFVGMCLKRLYETGLDRKTLFILTTDHGIAMPRAKGTLYDPGIKTALIMHKPGEFEGGRIIGELLSNIDLLPSLLEYAGAEIPAGIDGYSFLPLLKGGEYTPREAVFSELTWHDQYNPQRSVRTKTHKYIKSFIRGVSVYMPSDIYRGPAGKELKNEYYAGERPMEELYDLEDDPLEGDNIAGKAEGSRLKQALEARLLKWMEDSGDALLQGHINPTGKQKKRMGEENDPLLSGERISWPG